MVRGLAPVTAISEPPVAAAHGERARSCTAPSTLTAKDLSRSHLAEPRGGGSKPTSRTTSSTSTSSSTTPPFVVRKLIQAEERTGQGDPEVGVPSAQGAGVATLALRDPNKVEIIN